MVFGEVAALYRLQIEGSARLERNVGRNSEAHGCIIGGPTIKSLVPPAMEGLGREQQRRRPLRPGAIRRAFRGLAPSHGAVK